MRSCLSLAGVLGSISKGPKFKPKWGWSVRLYPKVLVSSLSAAGVLDSISKVISVAEVLDSISKGPGGLSLSVVEVYNGKSYFVDLLGNKVNWNGHKWHSIEL